MPSASGLITLAGSLLLLTPWAQGLPVERNLASADGPAWTYRDTGASGEEPYGPSDWHLGYPDCALTAQSPINLSADLSQVVAGSSSTQSRSSRRNRRNNAPCQGSECARFDIEFSQNFCESCDLTFKSDSAVWQVLFDACPDTPYLKWQGETYNLLQIHIHSPSEHLIGGAEHAADIHMVHLKEGTTDQLLVVGVMFDISEYGNNIEIQKVWDVLGVGGVTTTETFTTAIYDILPASPSFTHYTGSLTTPPCTEGVTWIVMNEPNFLGKRQLDEYRRSVAMHAGSKVDEFGNTNRPAQPLNGRPVYYVPS